MLSLAEKLAQKQSFCYSIEEFTLYTLKYNYYFKAT